METWLPAPDYVGRYEVSSEGRVRSLLHKEPRILRSNLDKDGYPRHWLRDANGVGSPAYVHRLVCRAFHGERPRYLHTEVAHLDGDRTNARAANLKWVSHIENHFHRRAHGTHSAGEKHPRAKLTVAAVLEIRASDERRTVLAHRYGVSKHTISDARRGRRWQCVP